MENDVWYASRAFLAHITPMLSMHPQRGLHMYASVNLIYITDVL